MWFSKKPRKQTVALVILDGFGIAPPSKGNAIYLAKTPNYDRMLKTYPNGQLIASGESVGLPANEVGNTEVGHLTMGAGRVIYQDLRRISMAMEDGSIRTNRALIEAINQVKANNSRLHIAGLVSKGQVHSSLDHLYGLLKLCGEMQVAEVIVHAFTDGRDAAPMSGIEVLRDLEIYLSKYNGWRVGSVMGRYFAMDRDRRWERTKSAYELITSGKGELGKSGSEVLGKCYEKEVTDEFVPPTILGQAQANVLGQGDAIIFFNFRVDRPKQLVAALTAREFESLRSFEAGFDADGNLNPLTKKPEFENTFTREKVIPNLCVVTMTQYHKNLPVSGVAFEPQQVEDGLVAVMASNGMKHLHLAESEKERFVKYYINGMLEEALPGQVDVIVPSPKVSTYDKKPEMSLGKTTKVLEKSLRSGEYDFIVMNVANPDMVAHSGDAEATMKAVEYTDVMLGRMEKAILKNGGVMIITADHGNAEDLLTFKNTGFFYTSEEAKVNTQHSDSPVPIIMVSERWRGQASELPFGSLADIAPTILALQGLPVPAMMTGKDLSAGIKRR